MHILNLACMLHVVHKRMYQIRMKVRIVQPSNVICALRILLSALRLIYMRLLLQ